MLKKFLMMAMVAVTASIASPSASRAGYSVTLQSGSSTLVINDNDVNDTAAASGVITTSPATSATVGGISFGGYRIGLSSNAVNDSTVSSLTTNSTLKIYKTTSGAGQLTITISNDTFSLPGTNPAELTLSNALTVLSITSGGSVVSNASASPDSASTSDLTLTSGGFLDNSVSYHRTGETYSISQVFNINLGNNGNVNFSGEVDVVNATPVPSALILAAFGIPAFGLLRRRFASKVEATTAV